MYKPAIYLLALSALISSCNESVRTPVFLTKASKDKPIYGQYVTTVFKDTTLFLGEKKKNLDGWYARYDTIFVPEYAFVNKSKKLFITNNSNQLVNEIKKIDNEAALHDTKRYIRTPELEDQFKESDQTYRTCVDLINRKLKIIEDSTNAAKERKRLENSPQHTLDKIITEVKIE